MAHAILENSAFKTALGFAKAFAMAANQPELTPSLLLLGAATLSRKEIGAKAAGIVKMHAQDIENIKSQLGLDSGAIQPVEDKFPIGKEVRGIIADKNIADMAGFVSALVEISSQKKSDGVSRIANLMAEEAFKKSVFFASELARAQKIDTVNAELLVVGAVAALKNGQIINRPGISTHITSNASNIDFLMAARGWTIADNNSLPKNTIPLPLATELIDAIEAAEPDSDIFAIALNVGLNSAAQLRMRERIAYHETGHAIVSLILRPGVQIEEVSLVPKGDADGYVSYQESSPYFKLPTSREDFLASICVSLAGRGAEQKKFGHDAMDAGASSDLQNATQLTWRAIAEWGLDHEFGPVALNALEKAGGGSSGWLFDRAHQRLQTILKEAVEKTDKILFDRWTDVEYIARDLLIRQRLSEEDLLRLIPDISAAPSK